VRERESGEPRLVRERVRRAPPSGRESQPERRESQIERESQLEERVSGPNPTRGEP
jgi:hypothetical protein